MHCLLTLRFSEDLTAAPSKQERAELAEVLFKCSGPFKRAVSPLLPWPAVLGYLCGELRECRLGSQSQEECLHAFAMRMEEPVAKAFLDDLARRIRADPAAFGGEKEAGLVKDDWIEQFQQQVVYVPGISKGKRLVDDVEMRSYLELGKQMKANGNESFARRDFDFAFTRCGRTDGRTRPLPTYLGDPGRNRKHTFLTVHPQRMHLQVLAGRGAAPQRGVPGPAEEPGARGAPRRALHQPGRCERMHSRPPRVGGLVSFLFPKHPSAIHNPGHRRAPHQELARRPGGLQRLPGLQPREPQGPRPPRGGPQVPGGARHGAGGPQPHRWAQGGSAAGDGRPCDSLPVD